MTYKNLFTLLFVLICMVMLATSFVLVLGEINPKHPLITHVVVRVFGIALGLGAYKGLLRANIIQRLSR